MVDRQVVRTWLYTTILASEFVAFEDVTPTEGNGGFG